MMTLLLGFLVSYVAIVAHWNGAAIGSVPLATPAAGALIALSCGPRSLAVVWPFVIGLSEDAFDSGPLGVHAAILTLAAPRWSRSPEMGRWMVALFFLAWCDGVLPAAIEGLVSVTPIPFGPRLFETTLSAFTTALLCGGAVVLWRWLAQPTQTRHHFG